MVSRPSSSGLGALQASNSRISLVLTPPPPSTSFHPGDVLRSIVTLHGDHSYTSLSLRLVGQTHAVIMGKDRWVSSLPPSSTPRAHRLCRSKRASL